LALELSASSGAPTFAGVATSGGAGGGGDASTVERTRLGTMSRLVRGGLILVEEPERPFLTRSLRVPDRITAHLLGDDRPEPAIEALVLDVEGAPLGSAERLTRAIRGSARLIYVRERTASVGRAWATAALADARLPVVGLDLARITAGDDAVELATAAVREARLRGAAILAGPIETIIERGPSAIRTFAEAPCPVVLLGQRSWDPAWSRDVPVVLEAPLLGLDERREAWQVALRRAAVDRPDLDPAAATAGFRLDPEQVRRAALAARQMAAADGRPVEIDDLTAGARAQNAGGLERLARRVAPTAGWGDLILPADTLAQLTELTVRARHRELVLGEWAMGG